MYCSFWEKYKHERSAWSSTEFVYIPPKSCSTLYSLKQSSLFLGKYVSIIILGLSKKRSKVNIFLFIDFYYRKVDNFLTNLMGYRDQLRVITNSKMFRTTFALNSEY